MKVHIHHGRDLEAFAKIRTRGLVGIITCEDLEQSTPYVFNSRIRPAYPVYLIVIIREQGNDRADT
jgi:hypothetical protein